MNFLCRAMGRKPQKEMPVAEGIVHGRITGSDSVDTLVQIDRAKKDGIKQSARRFVIYDFVACTDEELTVRRGEVVYILYRDHDWFYVTTPSGCEGFIPTSFCAKGKESVSTRNISNRSPLSFRRSTNDRPRPVSAGAKFSEREQEIPLSWGQLVVFGEQNYNHVKPFCKTSKGNYLVLFDFVAKHENDLDVKRGEIVLGLNDEDREWVWVRRGDYKEGFVPYRYICPLVQRTYPQVTSGLITGTVA